MSTPVRRLLIASRPEWPRLALAAMLGALAIGCSVALLATSAWLISEASLRPPILTLEVAFVAVRAFGLGRGVFRYAERLVGHDAAFRSLTRLRVRVYDHLARLGPAGLPAFRRGDVLTRMVADVDASQDLSLRVVIPGAAALLVGAGSVLVAFLLLPAAGLILAIALIVAGIVVPWLTTWAGGEAQRRTTQVRGDLSAEVVDALAGAGDLLAFGGAESAVARARELDARLTRLSARSAAVSGLASALATLAMGAAVVASLVVAIPAVLDGRLAGTSLAVVALLPLATVEAVAGMPAAALALRSVRASAARIAEVVDTPPPVPDPTPGAEVPAGPLDVRLRELRVRWKDRAPIAVDGVSLVAEVGRRVAIVGSSGAGKSTLAAALLRFLPHDGEACIGGVDVLAIEDTALRRAMTAVLQDAHVFDSSVAENLRLARRDATDDDMVEALRRAHLDGWLAGLPDGLHTRVGARGTGMSGGERQRLALARVLLADTPVVVLDEPTEHLDPATADVLARELLEATAGRTTIYITHRLAGLELVDEIVVLEHGRVTERGSLESLLAADGSFARHWRLERGDVDG